MPQRLTPAKAQSLDPELRSAHPPLHRLEVRHRAAPAALPDTDAPAGQDLALVLTALQPELGWPRLWAWLPMRRVSANDWHPLQPDVPLASQALLQAFEKPAGDGTREPLPGEPLRHALPMDFFEGLPEEECALLCLFVYADARTPRREGERPPPGLEDALRDALAQPPLSWRHALLQRPDAQPEQLIPGQALSLVLAACQYPPGVLDPSRPADTPPELAGPAQASLARLLAYSRGHARGAELSLLLLAGDQIYADASGGLADAGTRIERYAKPYQHFKAGLVRQLPPSLARIVHAPDDHEIEDNWEPVADPQAPDGLRRGPFFDSAVAAAWAARWEPGDEQERPGLFQHFWHDFVWRGAAFFIGDTRTEREPRHSGNWREARIFSREQEVAFAHWLRSHRERPRLVLTGSLLLPRRRACQEHAASALHSDAWCGYPASLKSLLAELWAQQADGVVFLSGDEHRSGFVSAEICALDENGQAQGQPIRLHSIHSSALYAPWPFAVTDVEALAEPDEFTFPGPVEGQVLRCRVSAWQDFPGDGFALLRVEGTELQLWYDRAERPLYRLSGPDLPAPDGSFWLGL